MKRRSSTGPRRGSKAPAKAAKASPTKARRGRPPADPALVASAVAEVLAGKPVAEAAAEVGIAARVIYRALEVARSAPAARARSRRPEHDEPGAVDASAEELPPIDAAEDPLVIARAMLDRLGRDMASLRADSPRLNPARAQSRQFLKLISELEKARAKVETPEQAAERKRREDAETRRAIEQYVVQYEREAAAAGVCLHCGAPRSGAAA